MSESLQIRVHTSPQMRKGFLPTLIYLPGLHGDWTLIGSFRRAVQGRVNFVEFTYPRSLTWRLDDYAAEIEAALERHGVTSGWLLAESYGSQVAWQLVRRGHFRAEGVILAGGFVQHPTVRGVRFVRWCTSRLSAASISPLLWIYAKACLWRFRHAPEVLGNLQEFLSRRTEADMIAARHRLDLIAENDPSAIARRCELPVYSLTALLDPVVPWMPVRRWLRRNCPGLRADKVIWRADHAVLASAPERAAHQILNWMGASEDGV